METVNDIVVGQDNIARLFGRSWNTVKKMIEEDGYPVSLIRGRWQCSRIQVEMRHRELQELRSQKLHTQAPVNP